jgi:hypothetical protein
LSNDTLSTAGPSGCTLGVIAYFLFIFPVLGIDPAVVITDGFSNMLQILQSLF